MHTIFSPTVSPDSPEYLGRLVISYSSVYTVVRTRQSYGRPELFIATPEGQENRENYTGGSGYYLSGPYRHSGWTIRKESLKYGLPRGSQAVLDFAHWLETAPR